MKKSLQTIIACLLCALCLFSVACVKTPTSSSGSASGGSGNIEPDEYYVTEFSVLTPPTKTKYNVGEKFDYSGMRLKAVWNDGEEEEIGAYECDEISPKGALAENVTEMTFEYYGKKTTYPITVEKKEIGSLTIDTSKINLRVVAGSYVNLKDIAVTINYADGRSDAVTDYSLTENGKEVETPSRYLVEAGEHIFAVSYLGAVGTFSIVGFNGVTYTFDANSIASTETAATKDSPVTVAPANTVKNYKKVDGSWTEYQTKAFVANQADGITGIKANAVLRIHFYSENASFAKFGMNAGTYYLTSPAVGKISPVELPKLFSKITLNGSTLAVKDGTLPGGEKWIKTFGDVDLCEGYMKEGDNVLELTLSDYYWMSGMASDENYGKQLYSETDVSIRSLTILESVQNEATLKFGGSSINSSLTASTAENPLFVEPANTVKNYKKVDGSWTETTSNAYGVNDSEGIVRIKANAVIKIHFYRETASFAKISVNAAAYYLMEPAIGKTYPVEFEKLFSSVTLNGVKVDIKNGTLPGAEKWTKTFVDADLCEGNLKAGDNVLELTVSDYYWMSKFSQSESDGKQLYGETDFAIKSLTLTFA